MSENTTYQQQTLFAEDSLAKMLVLPEKEPALKGSALRYGRNSIVSFAKFAPDGSLLKMSGDYTQVTMENSLEKYYGTWPQAGTMRNGTVYQRQSLERHNYVIEFSLLPTPRAILGEALDFLTFNLRTEQFWENTGDLPARLLGMEYKLTGKMQPPTREIFLNPSFCEWIMGFPMGWTKIQHQSE